MDPWSGGSELIPPLDRGVTNPVRPGKHHVTHLLHALSADFTIEALESVTEEQAINKQLHTSVPTSSPRMQTKALLTWTSLYRTSKHTFMSMTAQRSLRSRSREALYPNANDEPDDSGRSRGKQIALAQAGPASPTSSSGSRNREVPVTPTKHTRVRVDSGLSSASHSSAGDGVYQEEGMIRFRLLGLGEKEEMDIAMRRRMWDFVVPATTSLHAQDTG